MKRPGTLILFLLTVSTLALAQTPHDIVTQYVDWTSGRLTVRVERPVTAEGARGPEAIARTQRAIQHDSVGIIVLALTRLQYDSLHTITGLLSEQESLIAALERAARRGRAVDRGASRDLQSAYVLFEVDLYEDLGRQFVEHERPVAMDARVGWVPHVEYTGILIYAAEELPVFGTDERALLAPALFPGLYYHNESGELIYRLAEAENINPRQLATDGPVAYTADIQAVGLAERLGPRPLLLLAAGVFGATPTDVVLSYTDAEQILASAHNQALIRDGRVVIVAHPNQL